MTTFRHILVPTDFGEAADEALELGLTLAEKLQCKLTIMHANWLPPTGYIGYAEDLAWPTGEMAREVAKQLEAMLAKVKPRYSNIDAVTVFGEPWRAILDAAKDRAADLILVGTHGRRGLSRFFLGSVAEKVVRMSPVPVITVPAKAERREHEKEGPVAPAART